LQPEEGWGERKNSMKQILTIISHTCHCEAKPNQFLFLAIMLVLLLPAVLLADAEDIFKENSKAVVVIISYDSKGIPIGQGSGFVVREDGAVITNYHVISNAVSIEIIVEDKIFELEGFLSIDKENDIVVLKANAQGLVSVKIGDISKAHIGEKVYVISSPQGLENTISDGILSGGRKSGTERKILQITAPVSEGSSGGPVFNKNGEVIGIATFILKDAQNLNFAMPITLVKDKILLTKVTALKDADIKDYENTAEYWFNRGSYYGSAGLYDDAIEAFTSAIALHPNFAQAYNNRGFAYKNKGQHDRAIEDYSKAIALDPNDIIAYTNRGLAYADKGQHDRAIEDYSKVIVLDPNDIIAYTNRGLAYADIAQHDRAIRDYSKVIELDPNIAQAYGNRGIAYKNIGQHDRAIEDYNKAIALDPDIAQAYNNRGIAYKNKGQHDRAIEDYSKAIALDPNIAQAYNNRGIAYEDKGQHDRAIEDYSKAIALDPDIAQAYNNRGIAYKNLDQHDRAIEDYSKAIALDPNLAQAYGNRGLVYTLVGNIGRAISDLQKACDMGNEHGCKGLKMVLENR
jgi:tetratricopeptide (TPR) repeat protein